MLGSSYFAMGNSTESMYAYAFAQRIADSLRVVTLQLSTQIGLGYARDNLGQYEPAVYVTAEKMALACGAQQHLPYIWAGMAKLRELDRAYNEANALRKKQIAMSRHLGRHDMEIAGMEALARNYMSVRNYPAANSALNEAIKASLRYRNSLRAFDLKLAQGDLAKRLRNYDLASKHYQDARRLAESLSGKAMEICLMKIGDLWLSRGDCESAEKEYRHAYETTLKRVAAQGLEGGSLDLAASSEILSSFTKGLMHCEKAQESLALARQTRLHVLRKTLAAKVKAEVNMGGRYAEIHHRIDSLEQEIGQTADTTKTINLQNRILFWRSRLRALRPSASDSLWLAEMTKNLQPLPALQKSLVEQNAVALFFLVGQNATVVFAIHPDTLMGRLVSINKDTLRDRVLKIGSFFALDQGQPSTQGVFLKVQLTVDSKAARRLLEELVYPVLPKLPDKLILIPDDVLCLLPFDLLLASARLADKPKPPMSDLRLDGIPRTQIALTLEDIIPNVVQQPCKALLMANELPVLVNGRRILPPLSSALQEVENIADLLPAGASKKAANEKATRDFFFANAPDYGVYHFATHVQLSDWSPDYAKLYFGGPNGKSEPMYDFQLDRLDSVRAKLAVLSACNTALGRFQPGSGLLSFVLSFTDIGVPSVVASLWPVDDNITKELMVVFYDGLRKGYSYSAALALAKQHLIQDGHTNPHEWAGFVLFGKDGVLKFQEDRSARFLKYLLALVLTVALLAILRRFFPSRAIAAKS
jgi:tetratricopeptide (TPR) repeat protein